jgi:hypothetical protein
MGVVVAVTDVAYPYVCGVYCCSDCGATEERHGSDAGFPPPHWRVERTGEGESGRVVCPHCAS